MELLTYVNFQEYPSNRSQDTQNNYHSLTAIWPYLLTNRNETLAKGLIVTDVNFRHNPTTLIQWNARPPVLQVRQSFVATYLYNLGCQKILMGVTTLWDIFTI